MISYGSSLRALPLASTLANARKVATTLGITRITEITQLDRIGVPVFVSIRPDAPVLCVCAGKGLTPEEAQVGAYMEAIEIAWSEVGRSGLPIVNATVRDVLDTRRDPRSILSLCPIWGQAIDLDARLPCTPMNELGTDVTHLVPSELVFFPLTHQAGGARFFGSTTNGLASGNTVLEATVHALTEVIERDVTSHHLVQDRSMRIELDTLPATVATLAARLESAGFGVIVRWLPNDLGVPVFQSVIYDRAQPWLMLRGDGCHPVRSIAATRAISETIQCRLSLIHGGRDDLTNVYAAFARLSVDEKTELYEKDLHRMIAAQAISYDDLTESTIETTSLDACLDGLLAVLRTAGFSRVLRVVYTPFDYPVQVVRVIVPGLECYSRDARRIGPRLRRLLKRGAALEAMR